MGHLVRQRGALELEIRARPKEEFASRAPATRPGFHLAFADKVLPGRLVEKHVDVAFPFKRILRDSQVLLDLRIRPLRHADELRHRKARLGKIKWSDSLCCQVMDLMF